MSQLMICSLFPPRSRRRSSSETIADISIWSLNVPELEKDLSVSVSERIAIVDTHLDTRELQFLPIVLHVLEIKTASFADGFIPERWVVRGYISLLLFSPCIVGFLWDNVQTYLCHENPERCSAAGQLSDGG